MDVRTRITVQGIVQGVGFRPFVFAQAKQRALRGQVRNNAGGVLIDLEGEPGAIDQLIFELTANPPPLARIEAIYRTDHLPASRFADFRIVASSAEGDRLLPVCADFAVCDACLREMKDPQNRRYRYPFINCTHCGPRFTIIEDLPYDRPATTMRDFPLCAACTAEYDDPLDRRYHAEATACPACGPQLYLTDHEGRPQGLIEETLEHSTALVTDGKILAIKGIGGFHLACDALDRAAVERLRQRKLRADKPFAMMARSVDLIRRYCVVSEADEALLSSSSRPVVLMEKRPGGEIPHCVAPGVNTLGFMLPYAPLHHLLLEKLDRPLIMTSANVSEEPIAYRNDEALKRLGAIADYFLLHDRRIHMRADDSLARTRAGRIIMLRRSRGYAPQGIKTAFRFESEVLACGAHLKNTFCFGKNHYALISHHIGDLENFETLSSFTEGVEHYQRLFDLHPLVLAHDLHPDFLSTKYAAGVGGAHKVGVQHHHAHVASCMAEHRLSGPVIGVAFDGTGLGPDETIWGGEFLVADFARYERRAHLRYVPLAGGDAAIRQPWRSALSYLRDALGSAAALPDLPGWQELDGKKIRLVESMMRQGINSVPISSCGRLFDAVSAILGVSHEASYEGQAAIKLEGVALKGVQESYSFDIRGGTPMEIDLRATIRALVVDALQRKPVGFISAKFHNTVAAAVVELCRKLRVSEGINQVCLSGGVFQNVILLERVLERLGVYSFEVFYQCRVPTNDGGLSFGQAAVANETVKRGG